MLGSLATNLVPSPHHSFGLLFILLFTEALLEKGKVVVSKYVKCAAPIPPPHPRPPSLKGLQHTPNKR